MLNLEKYNLKNNQTYNQLPCETKELIQSIDKIVSRLFAPSLEIFERNINVKCDTESQWISYVLVIESTPDQTLYNNKKFIEYCLSHDLRNLLTSNVVFRFETRNVNATAEHTEFTRCR